MPETMYDLLVRNGGIVLESGVQDWDIGINRGKIAAMGHRLNGQARDTINADGCLVFPGFIDAHTHMGVPSKTTTSADDFASGSLAAAFGGVTTILDFTVQGPGESLREALELRFQKAHGKTRVDYALHINITDEPDRHLSEIPMLIGEGFCSFKVFSTYRQAGMMVNWDQFRRVLKYVHGYGGLLMLHAEDNEIVERLTAEYVNAGKQEAIYHGKSRPAEAEAKAIEMACQIAGELSASLYIVHVSSKAGLEAALRARQQGIRVYLETCPQYLFLTEAQYSQTNGHRWIATPPLRTQSDCDALWEALALGLIDVVATDHCPFTISQKDAGSRAFHTVPNGLAGVETLFSLLYTYGVVQNRLSLRQLIRVLAKNPAQIFGLAHCKGEIRVGADADLAIWNPQSKETICAETLHGKADWTPYEGTRISGCLAATILRGQVLVLGRQFVGKNVYGEQLRSRPFQRGRAGVPDPY